ncbi:MAG: CHAD domain-containing protein [Methylovulum sp.]|nr:CHAD domain-containing protein [Methylovulum sp.]
MSLQFEFPVTLTTEKFITQLSHLIDVQLVSHEPSLKTYYDSFDWRLYSKGIICEFNHSKNDSSLSLRNLETNATIINRKLKQTPAFARQFDPGELRDILTPILEMRALLGVCTLNYGHYQVNIINKDEKTVLRLFIEDYDLFNNRVLLQQIKGYDTVAEHIITLLTDKLALSPINKPILLAALKQQHRKPKDYSSKLAINLAPDLRADIASKYIYSYLLKVIKDNEQGTIADTDSEFLHDFRVAVRRTRSGLSQLKGILPEETSAYYAEFFSWLGQITTPTRDLDVYLLHFDDYKASLPPPLREDLNPLHNFLLNKQRKTQQELAKKLRSAKYLSTLSEWEHYLKAHAPKFPAEANARLTIKQLADKRIWKIYNRVLQEGNAVSQLSEAEALHELRKTCKKLRYLMEFFQSLYPPHKIKQLIDHLKKLQDILGNFQDYQIQENHLKLFSEEMLANNVPATTFLAMGVVIQAIDTKKNEVRNNFEAAFADFQQLKNQTLFKALFANKGS